MMLPAMLPTVQPCGAVATLPYLAPCVLHLRIFPISAGQQAWEDLEKGLGSYDIKTYDVVAMVSLGLCLMCNYGCTAAGEADDIRACLGSFFFITINSLLSG